MNTIDWNEEQQEIASYEEVIKITLAKTNFEGVRVEYIYSNGKLKDGTEVGMYDDNESDETSRTPTYICIGHRTEKEYLTDFMNTYYSE